MYGMRLWRVFNRFKCGFMQNLQCWVNHELRHQRRRKHLHAMCGGQILDGIECRYVHLMLSRHLRRERRIQRMRRLPCWRVHRCCWPGLLQGLRGGLDHRQRYCCRLKHVHRVCCWCLLDGIGRAIVHGLRSGIDHRQGRRHRRDDMHGVRCGEVLDGIQSRGHVHRVRRRYICRDDGLGLGKRLCRMCCRVDHEHRRQ